MRLPELPIAASLCVEAACISLFGVEMGLKMFYMSPHTFFASPWHLAQFILLVLNTSFVGVQVGGRGWGVILLVVIRGVVVIVVVG